MIYMTYINVGLEHNFAMLFRYLKYNASFINLNNIIFEVLTITYERINKEFTSQLCWIYRYDGG